MALNNTGKHVGLDAIAAAITFLSLHTDVIGSGSGGEVTGGAPAYARKAPTWSAASGGSVAMSNQPVFDVPAATVRRVGFFGHVSNATPFYGDGDVTDEVFAAQGTYTVTSGSIAITG